MHVVDGPIRAPAREGADHLPGLVPQGVGQRGNGAQQHRARGNDGPGVLVRGARDDEEVGIDPVDHPLVLNVEGALLAEGQAPVHERRPVSADVVVRGNQVEDRRRTPGAVEAHVGDGEARSAVGAREGDSTVDERALGRVLRSVRGKGRARGHGDCHGGSSLSRHGHRFGGEGQVDALSRPIRRVMREQHALDLFGQRLPAQRVGVGSVGDVRQGHLEGPPGGSVTQVSLGTRGVRCPNDARVHGRGRGALGVHQTCTHAARRVESAIILLRVHDRTGGAHQEVRDHGILLGSGQGRKRRVRRHALTHEGSDRAGLSRRLGRAGQSIVVVAGGRGRDRAAGGRDLGLEPQVGGHAHGGEVGGVDPLGHGEDRGGGDPDLDRSALRGLDGVIEAVAVRGRNGRHRQVEPAIDRPLDGSLAVVPVSEQNAGGLAGQGLEGLDLVLDLHRVTARVVAAQLLEEDRARQVPIVRSEVLGQVLARAVARVDHAVRALGEGVEARAVSLAHATQGPVADQVITEGDGTHDFLLVDRGHGEGRGEGCGEAERAVVGVVGSTIALYVTGGRVDGRALRA